MTTTTSPTSPASMDMTPSSSVRGVNEEEHAEARDEDLERDDEGPVAHALQDATPDERADEHDRADGEPEGGRLGRHEGVPAVHERLRHVDPGRAQGVGA